MLLLEELHPARKHGGCTRRYTVSVLKLENVCHILQGTFLRTSVLQLQSLGPEYR